MDRKFSKTHEWFLIGDDSVTMGITQHAADELTDITFVELPAVGARFDAGEAVSEVESVKATSEIFTVAAGEVLAVNDALTDHPELINDDAFGEGWLIKFKADSTEAITALLDANEYEAFLNGGA